MGPISSILGLAALLPKAGVEIEGEANDPWEVEMGKLEENPAKTFQGALGRIVPVKQNSKRKFYKPL